MMFIFVMKYKNSRMSHDEKLFQRREKVSKKNCIFDILDSYNVWGAYLLI